MGFDGCLFRIALPVLAAGKADAAIAADLRTAGGDVDAGEAGRDEGLRVQVTAGWLAKGFGMLGCLSR